MAETVPSPPAHAPPHAPPPDGARRRFSFDSDSEHDHQDGQTSSPHPQHAPHQPSSSDAYRTSSSIQYNGQLLEQNAHPTVSQPDQSITDQEPRHDNKGKEVAPNEPSSRSATQSPTQITVHSRTITNPQEDGGFNFGFERDAPAKPITPIIHLDSLDGEIPEPTEQPKLPYFHVKKESEDAQKKMEMPQDSRGSVSSKRSSDSGGHTPSSGGEHSQGASSRPNSVSSKLAMTRPDSRGRSLTPHNLRRESARPGSVYARNVSAAGLGHSLEARGSVIDLDMNYSQQVAHQKLKETVGANAALLDPKKTMEMYRANVKKTNDSGAQFEFALLIVKSIKELKADGQGADPAQVAKERQELVKEARGILQKLADRGYPYAQYYLADGFASGFLNNGKPDDDKAFPFFVAAGKRGHAEAAYRAALCYEFGWGSRRDLAKAAQFLRHAAFKNHPGAAVRLGKACLLGDMGLSGKQREGITWLKRAAENADLQFNTGPYELGLLHVTGYGADVFKDEAYAAQLFSKSASLGHAEANLRMGEAYEHGLLGCPKDPSLSIHYYTAAAHVGLPPAMMGLCAWYMVGAEPVLQKDEIEAYQWARKAADTGMPKGEYAIGYFTEMGIGCRRDPLEANMWYARASEQGEERAAGRLKIIREAESGGVSGAGADGTDGGKKKNKKADKKNEKMAETPVAGGKSMIKKRKSKGGLEGEAAAEKGKDKDCMIM
ncbi:MAG: hypothetical protein M1831_000876 [Alyxoria varia]|nr:MAG: hypothetical protein M1831_000876 [Alyxoria varia]